MSNDFTTPPSKAEVDEWIANLSDTDKTELRRRQLEAAAVMRQQEQAPDFGNLSDQAFRDYCRKFGF